MFYNFLSLFGTRSRKIIQHKLQNLLSSPVRPENQVSVQKLFCNLF